MKPTVVDFERRHEIAVVTIDNPPVNALNQAVRQALLDALSKAMADDRVKALLLIGKGRQFSAGADIGEFGDATRPPPHLRDVVRTFDASDKPVVAALHGVALGGALELAMACHYRVSAPDARLGLSEVKFGIIPGAGGTQLLPRLIGPAKALEMISTGEPVEARAAAGFGLVDRLIEGDLFAGALGFVRDVAARRPLPRASRRTDRLSAAAGLFDAAAADIGRRARGAQAPQIAVAAVRAAVELPFDAGIERERELWAEAAASPESAAMRYVFRAERTAGKTADPSEVTQAREVTRVGVIGTGTMGVGIAVALANSRLDVVLVGRRRDRLDAAMTNVGRHYAAAVAKGKLTEVDAQARYARIAPTTGWDALAAVDLALETVVENMHVKRKIFARLDAACGGETILATNTSNLNVDLIAVATRSPGRVIGLHFFSPAHATKLVELVCGETTAGSAMATGIKLVKQLGKFGVVVRAGDGLVSTRMFNRYQRAANLLLLEGALPHDIDAAMVSFGMALGPFATADLAGLDVTRRIRRSEKQPPARGRKGDAIPDRLAKMGRFGQKAGRGYYRYEPGDRTPLPDPEVEAVIVAASKALRMKRRSIGDEEIVERCLLAMANAGAMLLAEGLARRASDVDVIWVDAYGFPRHRGGPMYHAGQVDDGAQKRV